MALNSEKHFYEKDTGISDSQGHLVSFFGGTTWNIRSNGSLTLQTKRSGQKLADCPLRPK